MENIFNQLFIHVHVTANSTDYIITIANPNDSTNSQLLSEDGMVSSTYNFLIEKNLLDFQHTLSTHCQLSFIQKAYIWKRRHGMPLRKLKQKFQIWEPTLDQT